MSMFGFEFVPLDLQHDKESLRAMIESARVHLGMQVDYVLIPSNPRGKVRVDSLLGAYALRSCTEFEDVEFVPTIRAGSVGVDDRARGLNQIKSQILAVGYAGFASVALIGGDGLDGQLGGFGGVELISLAREMLGGSVCLISGSEIVLDDSSLARLESKIKAGVDRIITQPVFGRAEAEEFLKKFEELKEKYQSKVEVSLGILGIFDSQSARGVNEANLGFKIPDRYIEIIENGIGEECFGGLWGEIKEVANVHHASLYLCTAKVNDLRAFVL